MPLKFQRVNCCKFLMRKSASRLRRDQALLALRLPEPRRTGFGRVGAERLWLRAVAGFYGISRSAPPRAHPEREPQRPSAAEWDCPINASVPSPLSIRQPDRGVRPWGRRPKSRATGERTHRPACNPRPRRPIPSYFERPLARPGGDDAPAALSNWAD